MRRPVGSRLVVCRASRWVFGWGALWWWLFGWAWFGGPAAVVGGVGELLVVVVQPSVVVPADGCEVFYVGGAFAGVPFFDVVDFA